MGTGHNNRGRKLSLADRQSNSASLNLAELTFKSGLRARKQAEYAYKTGKLKPRPKQDLLNLGRKLFEP